MPSSDITKCVNGCDKRETCWRWLAQGTEYQSYSDFKPDDNGECEHYWRYSDENSKIIYKLLSGELERDRINYERKLRETVQWLRE